MEKTCPFGEKYQSYWEKRHEFFSLWDKGIKADEESLYSIKPEKLALELAEKVEGQNILDCFCGVGGSSIGFAKANKNIIAVDIDIKKIEMAKHNASLYGTEQKIKFIHLDSLTAIKTIDFDWVHMDPPWGGPEYKKKKFIELNDFEFVQLKETIELALNKNKGVSICLPNNFDILSMNIFNKKYEIMPQYLFNKQVFFNILFYI